MEPIFIDNYQCKINYKVETNYIDENKKELFDDRSSNWIKREIENWEDIQMEIFRYIKRYTFININPSKIDCSVVKEPIVKKVANRLIWVPYYHIKDSGIFENNPHYEIELELNYNYIENKMKELQEVNPGLMIVPETYGTPKWSDFDGTTSTSNKFLVDDIYKKMKGIIKVILSGIQDSNYPISYPEQNEVKKNTLN